MDIQSKNLSVEMRDMEPKLAAELMKFYSGERTGIVRLGPKGYLMPHKYKQAADTIYNLPLRDTDIFIVTYPRSGTTWTQELIWLVANDLDYKTASEVHLTQRFPYLEFYTLFHPEIEKELFEKNNQSAEQIEMVKQLVANGTEIVADLPSPRFIKTHMPLSLLPPTLLDKTKVVYVARDPRDVAVSYFYLCKQMEPIGFTGDFKDFWALFVKDLVYYSPFFDHLKEAWELRHHPNMLFLFYEDLVKDLTISVRSVSELLGKQISEQDMVRLCEHLSFDNFKKNKSVLIPDGDQVPGLSAKDLKFVRKGKSGGWRDHFDEDMTLEAERWMERNLRDTDMRFPQHTN